jgi:chromosome transmission fidelity protein 18
MSQSILGFHHLFASPARHSFGKAAESKQWGAEEEEEPLPFTGPRADFQASESEKHNRSTLLSLQSSLSNPLLRAFRSPEDLATGLVPYLIRFLTPDIKPVIVGGSGDQRGIASVRKEGEREMVKRAVSVMSGVGITFERGRLDAAELGGRSGNWVYRMVP